MAKKDIGAVTGPKQTSKGKKKKTGQGSGRQSKHKKKRNSGKPYRGQGR
jgi:hypothetical protein